MPLWVWYFAAAAAPSQVEQTPSPKRVLVAVRDTRSEQLAMELGLALSSFEVRSIKPKRRFFGQSLSQQVEVAKARLQEQDAIAMFWLMRVRKGEELMQTVIRAKPHAVVRTIQIEPGTALPDVAFLAADLLAAEGYSNLVPHRPAAPAAEAPSKVATHQDSKEAAPGTVPPRIYFAAGPSFGDGIGLLADAEVGYDWWALQPMVVTFALPLGWAPARDVEQDAQFGGWFGGLDVRVGYSMPLSGWELRPTLGMGVQAVHWETRTQFDTKTVLSWNVHTSVSVRMVFLMELTWFVEPHLSLNMRQDSFVQPTGEQIAKTPPLWPGIRAGIHFF